MKPRHNDEVSSYELLNFNNKLKQLKLMKLPENYKEEIIEMLADKLGYDTDEIEDTSSIKDDLGADSLDEVEIIMELEKKYDCSISDDLAETIETVSDIFSLLENL